ncbi:MAG: ankyrin repeat domain-containing protein [Acidobacteria bacterium]|nr:ankyrin repeat domain-containing protein [Acidobacteriota bacterium]
MKWLALLVCAAALAQAPAQDEDLLTAARKGDLPAVKALLEKGANLEAKSRYGQTPLYFAARNGHEEVVKHLLSKGANPKVNDTFYKSSLLAASLDKGSPALVEALLTAGKFNADELTDALESATRGKRPEIAAVLEKAGAKPRPKPAFEVSEGKLKLYAGSYKGDPVGEVAVVLKEGKLFLNPPGQSLELGAFDEVTFGLVMAPQVRVKFTVAGGTATELTILQGGATFVLKRVEGK